MPGAPRQKHIPSLQKRKILIRDFKLTLSIHNGVISRVSHTHARTPHTPQVITFSAQVNEHVAHTPLSHRGAASTFVRTTPSFSLGQGPKLSSCNKFLFNRSANRTVGQ